MTAMTIRSLEPADVGSKLRSDGSAAETVNVYPAYAADPSALYAIEPGANRVHSAVPSPVVFPSTSLVA